jgi:hypothetical protein
MIGVKVGVERTKVQKVSQPPAMRLWKPKVYEENVKLPFFERIARRNPKHSRPGRFLALYEQAVQAELSGASKAERLTFVALACYVLGYCF